MSMADTPTHDVQQLLERGLEDLWYPLCPSHFLKDTPLSLRRLGHKLALWRDHAGQVHALEDHCPHRGAPLSMGVVLGDRLACPYHGIEVRCDGMVTKVPASPGCTLEGSRAARAFHVQEAHGAIWLYNSVTHVDQPPPLKVPDELTSADHSHFLCYNEWQCDYRYALENVMDPMHGSFLHKQSHTGAHWMRLEIPYPKTGGPGGNFIIVGFVTPINPRLAAVFFWRCRRVSGWQRSAWRFLYRNRLEARHWRVLEQDRVMLEQMEPDARDREHLYEHDVGLSRLRRYLESMAVKQLQAKQSAKQSAAASPGA